MKSSIRQSTLTQKASLVHMFENTLLELNQITIDKAFMARFIHDLIIYDKGEHLGEFVNDCKKLQDYYRDDSALLLMAIQTLTKTYFVKDEVMVAHLMISPMRKTSDDKTYLTLGTDYKKTFINRPSFDLGNKKIEFDFSPKGWMLKLMRHARFLRSLLPLWHQKERQISLKIRKKLLLKKLDYPTLKMLENIKGYRNVRYEVALQALKE